MIATMESTQAIVAAIVQTNMPSTWNTAGSGLGDAPASPQSMQLRFHFRVINNLED
jgi:hypothetical protein